MANLRDKPLSREQCILMVHSKVNEWQEALESITTSIQSWQKTHEQGSQLDEYSDLTLRAKQKTSTLQSTKDHDIKTRGRGDQTDETRDQGSRDSSKPPVATHRHLVIFDARSQKMIEELTNSLQTARNQLFRSLDTSRSPESRRLERAHKLLFAKAKDGLSEKPDSSQIRAQIVQLESSISKSQRHCEDAATQLLRRGSCSSELGAAGRLLQQCSEEARTALEQIDVKSIPGASRPKTASANQTAGSSDLPSVLSLEVDDNDEDDDGNDPGLSDRPQVLQTKIQQLSFRSRGAQ